MRALLVVALLSLVVPTSTSALPSRPAGWPSTLELGMTDGPGGAAAMRATGFGVRYQYLAGGVNTASALDHGPLVTAYIQESIDHGLLPVFSYYMMVQSAPGNAEGEVSGVYTNLQNTATMRAYYEGLRLVFQRAGAFPDRMVVLHVEPDLWGHMQKRAIADDAASVPAQVAATGLPELAGLPDTVSGFARAVVALRDAHAPNVRLAYHLSVWGTDVDIAYSDPPDATVDALAMRAAAFLASLHAPFDLAFAEFSDRDSGFRQQVLGEGATAWWDAGDFARHVRFLKGFVDAAGKRVVLWQIPLGNTRMRAMNDTWNHYQDNRVEWLLDDASRGHLTAYLQAGVVALLFGRGADGGTCACDAAGDGVTNPEPINGNIGMAAVADDDGGFFRQKAAAYYAGGAMPLDAEPDGGPDPDPDPAPGPTTLAAWLSANRPVFHPGEALVLSARIENPGLPATADLYVGVLLPDGRTIVTFAGPQRHPAVGSLGDLASLPPIAASMSLSVPFAISEADFVVYRWSGGEPVGRYVFFVAAAAPGGLRADRIRVLATAEITFAPAPP
jgi:hypothetical protein